MKISQQRMIVVVVSKDCFLHVPANVNKSAESDIVIVSRDGLHRQLLLMLISQHVTRWLSAEVATTYLSLMLLDRWVTLPPEVPHSCLLMLPSGRGTTSSLPADTTYMCPLMLGELVNTICFIPAWRGTQ